MHTFLKLVALPTMCISLSELHGGLTHEKEGEESLIKVSRRESISFYINKTYEKERERSLIKVSSHHFTLIRLADNILLTTAVQPIPIQQIACPTAAVEAADSVGTHLLTTSISGIALIDVCILDRMISVRIVSNLIR